MNSQHGQEDVPALWSVIDVGNAYSNELPDIFPDGQCWTPREAHEQDNPYQAPQSIDNWVASCAAPSEQPPLSGDSVGVTDDAFPKFDGLSCQFLNSPNDMTHENSSYTSLGLPQYHVPGGADGAWPHQPSFPSTGAPDGANEPLDIQFSRPFFSGPQPSLPRRKSRYFRSHGSVGRPVSIPTVSTPSSSMDPLQRWRDSPPETEPASLSAIADALQRSPVRQDTQSRSLGRTPASSVSWTTCSSSSVSSSRSSKSNSFLGPVSSSIGRVRKNRRNKPGANDLRRFPCTFCCDAFKTKYDWARHEKSLHLDLDQWVCAPDGGSIVLPTTGRNHCAYCNMLDPTDDHLGSHNHHACHAGQEPRVFRRKDHLVQHLRVFHRLEALPIIDHWKIDPPAIVSRCGFCDEKLTTWKIRADHLSDHFRKGLTMRDWKGGNGFDPFVAAQVRNAIPPYTLAAEAKTLVPFSATDPRTTDHLSQILEKHALTNASQSEDAEGDNAGLPSFPILELSPTTYASFLALHLGRFAQRNISQGIFPDDQMFQDEARRLVYGSADGWEHTIADNNEWMSAFRTQHEIPE